MTITKERLYDLIDAADTSEYDVLFRLLVKFIPTDVPTKDEIDAIKEGQTAYERGEFVRHEDIDWS